MPVDLTLHGIDFLLQARATLAVAAALQARRFVGDHRQRRLERMREMAGLTARALDQRRIVNQHAVQILDQRRDFAGVIDRQAFGARAAYRAQLAAQAA